MMVRLKAPRVGDVVTVTNCEMHFYLPAGLPDRTEAVLVGREPGRYIVLALGREWNIPMQCVVHVEEECMDGSGFGDLIRQRFPRIAVHMKEKRWLDRWDRRVRKAEEMLERMQVADARRSVAAGG